MRGILLIACCLLSLTFQVKADVCFPSFEKDTSQAEVIFVGKVLSINQDSYWTRGTSPIKTYTFQVSESFKGLDDSEELITVFGAIRGCCDVNFISDSTYLVFAYENGTNVFWTNDCSVSGLLSETQQPYTLLGNPTIHSNLESWDELKLKHQTEKDSLRSTLWQTQVQLKQQQKERNIFLIIGIGLLILVISLLVSRVFKRGS